jgi:hypothetical protein
LPKESVVEEVLSRFYQQALDSLDARQHHEAVFERELDKTSLGRRMLADDLDRLIVRAQKKAAKEFAQDLAIGLAQKTPDYADQFKKSQQVKAGNQARAKSGSPYVLSPFSCRVACDELKRISL